MVITDIISQFDEESLVLLIGVGIENPPKIDELEAECQKKWCEMLQNISFLLGNRKQFKKLL